MAEDREMEEPARPMTIGQLATAAGLRPTALRYYEREGILRPSSRSTSGYRLYDPGAVEQLEFIRAAQAVGFSLEDIRTLLRLDQGPPKQCKAEVRALVQKRLDEVAQKMRDLERVQATLAQALRECEASGADCPVLAGLHASAADRLAEEV